MNRWLIAVFGVVLQLALGAVYEWSVFRTPLVKDFGWSISISVIMLVSAAIPFVVHPPSEHRKTRLVPPHPRPSGA